MMCQWFLKCTNEAHGDVAHPVLNHVPTCLRCADKLGLEFEVVYEDPGVREPSVDHGGRAGSS